MIYIDNLKYTETGRVKKDFINLQNINLNEEYNKYIKEIFYSLKNELNKK